MSSAMLNFVLSCSVCRSWESPATLLERLPVPVPRRWLCRSHSSASEVIFLLSPPPFPSTACAALHPGSGTWSLPFSARPYLVHVCILHAPYHVMNVANACSLFLSNKFLSKAVIFASSVISWLWLEKKMSCWTLLYLDFQCESCKKWDWSYNHR